MCGLAHRHFLNVAGNRRAGSGSNLSPAVARVFPYFLLCSMRQSNLDAQDWGWVR